MGLAALPIARGGEFERARKALSTAGGCLLTGPGGVGKTTLARAVADRFRVVQWVDVESLDRVAAVLAALQDRVDPLPLPGGTSVTSWIAGRPVLVVLDGADDVADDLSAVVEELPLGPAGPWLLVTSRVMPSEPPLPVIRLLPLPCTAGSDGVAPAVALFRRRYLAAGGDARLIDDEAVEGLVAMTGGLPAAIGIVAARTALLGFEDPPTVLDAADASVDLVVAQSLARLDATAAERLLALSTSASAVPRSLVAALTEVPPEEVGVVLAELARHGLLTAADTGVTMLPPVRRSLRRLAERSGVAERAADRHLRWCRDLVDHGHRPGQLSAHRAELASAVSRAAASSRGLPQAVEMAAALAGDLSTTLQHRSGHQVLMELIAVAEPLEDHPERDAAVRLLTATARMGSLVHGATESLRLLDRAERILSGTAPATDEQVAAGTLHRASIAQTRADVAFAMGDLAVADREATLARDLARERGDEAVTLSAETCLAYVRYESGRLDEADRLAESIATRARHGSGGLYGLARQLSGFCALERGATAVARAIALAELDRCHRTGERDGALEALFLLMAADPVHGAQMARHEMATTDAGSWLLHLQLQRARIVRALVGGDPQTAALSAADAAVVAATMPHRFEQIEADLLLGDASLALGDREQALQAFDASLTDAIRYGSVLRAADALDGWAAALAPTSRATGCAAAAAATQVRRAHGARRRPRPWLTIPVPGAHPPDGWVTDGRVTMDAALALRDAGLDPLPDRAHRADGAGGALSALSRSEVVVAGLVAEGCTNREISERLGISRRTVETHVAHTFQKLSVHTRSQLAVLVTRAASGS